MLSCFRKCNKLWTTGYFTGFTMNANKLNEFLLFSREWQHKISCNFQRLVCIYTYLLAQDLDIHVSNPAIWRVKHALVLVESISQTLDVLQARDYRHDSSSFLSLNCFWHFVFKVTNQRSKNHFFPHHGLVAGTRYDPVEEVDPWDRFVIIINFLNAKNRVRITFKAKEMNCNKPQGELIYIM